MANSKSALFSKAQSYGPIAGSGTVIAKISISGEKTGTDLLKLPVLRISESVHTARLQLDNTLDGTIHVLGAAGGIASCTMVCLDRITKSCKTSQGGELASALKTYASLRKAGVNKTIEVELTPADGGNKPLFTFKGIVNRCHISVESAERAPYVLVTYEMTGIWK